MSLYGTAVRKPVSTALVFVAIVIFGRFFLKQVISGLASGDRDEHHHGDDGLSRRQRFGYRDECFEALGKRVE
mgnify:CR=1 FL=1